MDIKRVTAALLKSVREWVEPAFGEIGQRLEALSARVDNMPRPDPAETEAMVKAHVAAAVASLAQGEKVEPAQIRAWLEEFVAARWTSMPVPQDGKDADPEQTRRMLDAMLAERIAAIPAPAPGKDADMDALMARLDAAVEAKFAALPTPKNGKDGESPHPDTIRLMVLQCAREAVAEMPVPKGLDMAEVSALIEAKVAAAIAAQGPGQKGDPGPRGEKGEPGEAGRVDVDWFVALVREEVRSRIADLPVPPKGEPGPPGRDAEPLHPDTVRLMVATCAREVLAEWPRPQDGKSVDMETLSALIEAKVIAAIAAVPKAQDGAPGRDADLTEVQRLIEVAADKLRAEIPAPVDAEAIQRAANDEVIDLLDELLGGLEDDAIAPPGPAVSVSVVAGQHSASSSPGPFAVADLSAQIEELKRTMMLPVIPVLDAKGNFVGARRVDPDAAAA